VLSDDGAEEASEDDEEEEGGIQAAGDGVVPDEF
jgi:hypothetical protein